jgi:hypothetical protein
MRTWLKAAPSRAIGATALALLFLGAGGAGRGDAITPARQDLVNLERKLAAARGEVSATAEQLTAAESLHAARVAVLRACQAAHDAVDRVRKEAERAAALARIDAARAAHAVSEAGVRIESSRRELERVRESFINRPLVAYDQPQRGRLTLNVLTGALDVSLETSLGVNINVYAGDLEALLAGRFKLPEVDPLEMAAAAPAIHERLSSNYADVRASLTAEYGADRLYMVSRRFLEWASRERLAGNFSQASLGSGRTVAEERVLARRQIQLEYEDFAAWLKLKGAQDLGPDPSTTLLELIRTGRASRLSLSVKTTPVTFTRHVESAGSSQVPAEFLRRLAAKRPRYHRATREATEKRPAVAVVWMGDTDRSKPLAAALEGDFRLSAPATGELARLLPLETDGRIRRLVGWTALDGLRSIDSSDGPRRIARAALDLRSQDIDASSNPGSAIVDLRRSDFGEIVAAYLGRLALGNSHSCELTALELDQSSGRVEAEFTLHHKHVWPSILEAQAQLQAALGPVGTSVDDLALKLADSSFESARARYTEQNAMAQAASARTLEARKQADLAADRVAAKMHELAILSSDLTRAQTDARLASEFAARARREAQAACALMMELDAGLRREREKIQALEHPFAGPITPGRRR